MTKVHSGQIRIRAIKEKKIRSLMNFRKYRSWLVRDIDVREKCTAINQSGNLSYA